MDRDTRVPAEAVNVADSDSLAWQVIAPVLDHLDSAGDATVRQRFVALRPGQQAVIAVHWCETDVSNGGFDQYFTNSWGAFAADAVASFQLLGAPEAALVLQEAMGLAKERPFTEDDDWSLDDEVEREEAIAAYRQRFAALEDRYFELLAEEIYLATDAFIRAHIGQFIR